MSNIDVATKAALQKEITRATDVENQLKEDLSGLDERVTKLENGGGSGSGVSTAMKNSLWELLQKCAYITSDVSAETMAFKAAWGITDATLESITLTLNTTEADEGTATSALVSSVIGTYSDSTTASITGYTVSPEAITEGENSVTVSYSGITSNAVSVTGKTSTKTLTSISAVDNQESYPVGTNASDLDLTVTATYSDSSTAVVTGWTAEGTVAEGENTFAISYGGKSCSVTVTGESESTINGYIKDGLQVYFDGIQNTRSGHASTTTVWEDLSDNQWDAVATTSVGSIVETSATFESNCAVLDGSLEFVNSGGTMVYEDMFNTSADGTLEVVIKQDSDSLMAVFLPANGWGSTKYNKKDLWYRKSSNGYVITNGSSAGTVAVTSALQTVGAISVTYNSSEKTFNKNNVEVTDFTTGGEMATGQCRFAIGSNYYENTSTPYRFSGRIYAIRYYNRVLTDAERTANYNNDVKRFGIGE